jgi:hypothetical protein
VIDEDIILQYTVERPVYRNRYRAREYMNIYYYASHIYQLAYSLPLYRALGGIFIAKKFKRYIHCIYSLRNANTSSAKRAFLNAPKVIICKNPDLGKLEGILFSFTNIMLPGDMRRCTTFFLGHGSGDKKYGTDPERLKAYDYHFLTGPKHLEKLRDSGLSIPDEKLIKIGNVRFDDYINKKIDRTAELDRLGIVDRTRKNVLYAPTWEYGNGTLEKYGYTFCKEITRKYNLIIRPHYHDRGHILKMKLWARLQGIRHLYFSNPADIIRCDTMFDFMVSDIMISDTSSILYEYLITGNPIIVAQTEYDDLHAMPDTMTIMNFASRYDGSQNIVEIIEENLSDRTSKNYHKQLLDNCFYFNDGRSVERVIRFIESLSAR